MFLTLRVGPLQSHTHTQQYLQWETMRSTSTTNHQTTHGQTRTHTHTLPSRLQSQHSKRSCQNSGTSNTAIDRWLWRSRKRLRRHVVDVELTPLDGSYAPDETFASWIYIPCVAFSPLLSTSFCHSCNLPFSPSKSPFSFPQSASSSL